MHDTRRVNKTQLILIGIIVVSLLYNTHLDTHTYIYNSITLYYSTFKYNIMIYGCGGERILYIMRNRAEYSQSRFRNLDK